MPAQALLQGRPVYYCTVCFLAYEDEATARKCEEHCRQYPSCSLDLARRAVGTVAGADD